MQKKMPKIVITLQDLRGKTSRPEGSEASSEFSDDGEPAEDGESSSDDSQAPNLEGS